MRHLYEYAFEVPLHITLRMKVLGKQVRERPTLRHLYLQKVVMQTPPLLGVICEAAAAAEATEVTSSLPLDSSQVFVEAPLLGPSSPFPKLGEAVLVL